MGRKSNTKGAVPAPPESSEIDDDQNTNGLYKKRLRSWKRTPTKSNANQMNNAETASYHRSTMYTFPIQLRHDPPSVRSNTVLSETSTPESVFYCPTISTSMQTTGDLNNNHVTTWNLENTKRKYQTISRESLFSEEPYIQRAKIATSANNDPPLTCNFY